MIYRVDSNSAALSDLLSELAANNDPRHMWINGAETIVYTGDDLPTPPEVSE